MRRPWWPTPILAGLIVSLALGATEQDLLERNRRLLDHWRADPDHGERLRRDLLAFHALPPPRQEQLRRLDGRLNDADGPTRARLWAVLERYNAWLWALPPEQRQRIAEAPEGPARLAVIRDLRLRERLPGLPTGQQKEVAALPAGEQPDRIAALRAGQRRQRQKWARDRQAAEAAIPRPRRPRELPRETWAHFKDNVRPRLTKPEEARLRGLEGTYPGWLLELDKLADAHPVLPPLPGGAVTAFDKIPGKMGARFGEKARKGRLAQNEGQWPQFALDVQRAAKNRKLNLPPLGASRPQEYPPQAREVITRELIPSLNRLQAEFLKGKEGHWPDYPLALHRLAKNRGVFLPGLSVPGPPEMWEAARVGPP